MLTMLGNKGGRCCNGRTRHKWLSIGGLGFADLIWGELLHTRAHAAQEMQFVERAADLQAGAGGASEFRTWIFVFAIVTVSLLFLGFALWLIVKQVARSRETSHLERMKVIESGQPLGPSEGEKCQAKQLHNVFWISFWIGAGVPMAATAAASSVMIQTRLEDFAVLLAIWICVAIIAIASVVCATVLMILTSRPGRGKLT